MTAAQKGDLQLIDSHAHVQDEQLLPDVEEVLERALEAGVTRIVCPGYDLASSRLAVELAEKYPMLGAAVGLHPGSLEDAGDEAWRELIDLTQHPQVVAVGEMGLDYAKAEADKKTQGQVFRRQLEIAGEAGLPAIVHNRDSHGDMLTAISDVGRLPAGGVMHCFSGSLEFARNCIEYGYYISFAGPVTFKNARRAPEVVAGIDLEWLLCETDSPYLSPEPWRGRRNEPARVVHVAEKMAEILEMDLADLAPQLTANTRKLFWRLD